MKSIVCHDGHAIRRLSGQLPVFTVPLPSNSTETVHSGNRTVYVFVSGKNVTCHVCYYCLFLESIIILQHTQRAGARYKIPS